MEKDKFTMLPAIKSSKGEVLAFLDDDDEWKKGKLNKIYRLFCKNDKLGYYHNNYSFIDAYGKPFNSDIRLIQRKKIDKLKKYYIKNNKKDKKVWEIIEYGLFFNNSCVAMRRRIIVTSGLGSMPFGVDLHCLSSYLLQYYIIYNQINLFL